MVLYFTIIYAGNDPLSHNLSPNPKIKQRPFDSERQTIKMQLIYYVEYNRVIQDKIFVIKLLR